MSRRDWGTTLVLLIDLLAALGVIAAARLFLDLSTEGFLLLSSITLVLALIVALLLRASPRPQERSPGSRR